jgi:hypothetical protein
VVDVIRRLEAELLRAQSGGTSEVLQLLIGRDDHVRYQIPKHEDLVQIQGATKHETSRLPADLLRGGCRAERARSGVGRMERICSI